jgi:hypothetical protein
MDEPYDDAKDCKRYASMGEAEAFLNAEVEYVRLGCEPEVVRHPLDGIHGVLEAEAGMRFGKVTKRNIQRVVKLRQKELKQRQLAAAEHARLNRRDEPILNRNSGWGPPIPIRQPTGYSGPPSAATLKDALPIDKVTKSFELPQVKDEVRRIFEGRSVPYSNCLGGEWRFPEMWVKARELPEFQYPSAKWGSIGEILVSALHALDRVLHRFHPKLPAQAVADFWRSWEVHVHLANYAFEVGASPTAKSLAGGFHAAEEQARRAAEQLIWRLNSIAAETELLCSAEALQNSAGLLEVRPLATTTTPTSDAADEPSGTSDRVVRDEVAEERQLCMSKFKALARMKYGIKVTDRMVAAKAKSGKWNDRTMVSWWKRNDERCKPPHDQLIRKVLNGDPASIWPANPTIPAKN